MRCVRCNAPVEARGFIPELQLWKGRIYCIVCADYLLGMAKWKNENYERLSKVPGLKQTLRNLPV